MLPPLTAKAIDERNLLAVNGSNTTGTSQVSGFTAPSFLRVLSTAREATSPGSASPAKETDEENQYEDCFLPLFSPFPLMSSTAQEILIEL